MGTHSAVATGAIVTRDIPKGGGRWRSACPSASLAAELVWCIAVIIWTLGMDRRPNEADF